jgi:AraC-like DNA-binding protein
MIGVVFKPAALATIFRFRMAELTNARIDLTDALGREGRQLTEQVCEASSLAQRIGLLDDFLLRRLAQPAVRLNAADQAADLIVEKKGNVTIEWLAGETGVGRRYLEQQFVLKVGISPKHYARIQRIGHICNLLVHQQIRCQQPPNWHDFIYQAGYYDQSHFIREFLQFMDRQPSLYYKTNCELQHWLEAEAGVATG